VRSDAERLAELATEVGQRLSGVLADVIPDEARAHLVNAERELLTALFLIYEHQVGVRRPSASQRPAPSRSRRAATEPAPAHSRSKLKRIPIQ